MPGTAQIEKEDGNVVEVQADTLQTLNRAEGIILENGALIDFTKMWSLEVTNAAPQQNVELRIITFDGQVITGKTHAPVVLLVGQANGGSFRSELARVRRIDFQPVTE